MAQLTAWNPVLPSPPLKTIAQRAGTAPLDAFFGVSTVPGRPGLLVSRGVVRRVGPSRPMVGMRRA